MNILSQILNYETKNLFIDDILEKNLIAKVNATLNMWTSCNNFYKFKSCI